MERATFERVVELAQGHGNVPVAGPIGFPRVRGVGDVGRWCERLAGQGVLLLPGPVYDEPDHVRVGFGRADLPEALAVLESALPAPAAV